jgi:hypothetical protein
MHNSVETPDNGMLNNPERWDASVDAYMTSPHHLAAFNENDGAGFFHSESDNNYHHGGSLNGSINADGSFYSSWNQIADVKGIQISAIKAQLDAINAAKNGWQGDYTRNCETCGDGNASSILAEGIFTRTSTEDGLKMQLSELSNEKSFYDGLSQLANTAFISGGGIGTPTVTPKGGNWWGSWWNKPIGIKAENFKSKEEFDAWRGVGPRKVSDGLMMAHFVIGFFLPGGNAAKAEEVGENIIFRGFTQHGIQQAITKGFSPQQILNILRNGTKVLAKGPKGGTQLRVVLDGKAVVLDATKGSRNYGKIITFLLDY